MTAVSILFWASAAALFHSYVLYPLLVRVLTTGRKPNAVVYDRETPPPVTVIVAAHNEERIIERKIDSIFTGGYPKDKLHVIVGSDRSTDRTDEIVMRCAERYGRVELVPFAERTGKTGVLNALVPRAETDIVVLTDANVLIGQDTLFQLVRHFRNESISLVDSNMIYVDGGVANVSKQEKTYIGAEVTVKQAESLLAGCMMGPFGGCYALRRKHYVAVPPTFLVDDFYINMRVIEQGFRCINELNAHVYEEISHSLGEEFRRKVRIATGNFQNLATFWRLLFRPDAVAFCFWSHKVLRWLGPLFLLAVFAASAVLAGVPLYAWAFRLQVACYAVPLADVTLSAAGLRVGALRFVTHGVAMNAALFAGMVRYLRGVDSGVWQPTRRHG